MDAEENKEAFEELGQCIDTLDNLIAALQMPLPSLTHVTALRESLPELKAKVKQAYLGLGGEDVWTI